MTTLRQAAEIALEAMDIDAEDADNISWKRLAKIVAAGTALREALSEPEQKPVARVYRYGSNSRGKPWYGIHWLNAAIDTPDGTLLYLHSAPIPEGWVMVPKEPTAAMDFAGAKAADEMISANISKSMGPLGGHVVRDDYDDITLAYVNDEISSVMGIYKAMLAAAPKPE